MPVGAFWVKCIRVCRLIPFTPLIIDHDTLIILLEGIHPKRSLLFRSVSIGAIAIRRLVVLEPGFSLLIFAFTF